MAQDTTGLVLVQLTDGNKGNHGIIGPSRRNYGYRSDGDKFYMLESDAKSMEGAKQVKIVTEEKSKQEAPAADLPIFAAGDESLLDINGINAAKLDILRGNQHATLEYLSDADVEALAQEIGTSPIVARRISNEAKRRLEPK